MQEFRLPRHFLDDNPLDELSTAQITYFQMVTVNAPGFYDEIADSLYLRWRRRGVRNTNKKKANSMD